MTKQNFEQELSDKICADVREIVNEQWIPALERILSNHTIEVTIKVNQIVSKYDAALHNLERSYYALKAALVLITIIIFVGLAFLIVRDIKKDVKIDKIVQNIEDLGVPMIDRGGNIKFFPKDFTGDTIKVR